MTVRIKATSDSLEVKQGRKTVTVYLDPVSSILSPRGRGAIDAAVRKPSNKGRDR